MIRARFQRRRGPSVAEQQRDRNDQSCGGVEPTYAVDGLVFAAATGVHNGVVSSGGISIGSSR